MEFRNLLRTLINVKFIEKRIYLIYKSLNLKILS